MTSMCVTPIHVDNIQHYVEQLEFDYCRESSSSLPLFNLQPNKRAYLKSITFEQATLLVSSLGQEGKKIKAAYSVMDH